MFDRLPTRFLFAPLLLLGAIACGDGEQYDWDAAIAPAVATLEQIRVGAGSADDIEPADPADVDCPLADFGDRWMAEESGSLICAAQPDSETDFEGLIATVADLPVEQVAGDGVVLDEPTPLGPGEVVAGCGEDGCIAIWRTDGIRVMAFLPPSRDATAARAILEPNVTTVLDNLATFDLTRLDQD